MGLGMFVSFEGSAVRGTLQWSSYPLDLGPTNFLFFISFFYFSFFFFSFFFFYY